MPLIAKDRPNKIIPLWENTLQSQIKMGQAVPIISGQIIADLFIGGHANLVGEYARYIEYPLAKDDRGVYSALSNDDLLQITRYKRITDREIKSDAGLKLNYLDFVKSKFYYLAQTHGVPQHLLQSVRGQFDEITFSEFPQHLGYPSLETSPPHPLLILSRFPFKLYLTTSHHGFIERALRQAGKTPRTEFCRWHHGLEQTPSVLDGPSELEPDKVYRPSAQEPLVYHLYGYDSHPKSLVLTEDDYLKFLISVARHQGQNTDVIPGYIREALSYSALILLGYELQSWDFRVLFWGVIQSEKPNQVGISIQAKRSEIEQRYCEQYLDAVANCQVFWGTFQEYADHLLGIL